MDVKINGIQYDNINDDIFKRVELTEAVEYATIFLSHQPKIVLNPLDEVVIDGVDWYLVDYKWTIVEFDTPLYNYEIQIANPAIKLKGIILPNRAFTERLIGDRLRTSNALEQYLEIYAPDLELSSGLRFILNQSFVKEYQWANPSLFDVINTFLQEHEAVVTMSDFNTISYKYLKGVGNPINLENVTNIEGSIDFENYATNLRTIISRGSVNQRGAVQQPEHYSITETLKFITPGSSIFENDRFLLKLSHKIEKVLKMDLIFIPSKHEYHTLENVENYLYERRVYDALSIGGSGDKRTALAFDFEGDIIDGWDYTEKKLFSAFEKTTFENIIRQLNNGNISHPEIYDPKHWVVKIEYIPIISNFDVEVRNNLIHKKTIVASQDEPFVDTRSLGIKNQRIIDRTGQENITIYGVKSPPALLDYYEGYNIYAVDTMVNTTQYDWVAYAQKNYANVILSTVVDWELRMAEIVDTSRALIMNHINHVDLTFSLEPHTLPGTLSYTFDFLMNFSVKRSGQFIGIAQTFNDDLYEDLIDTFIIMPTFTKFGKSFAVNLRLPDNLSAGLSTQIEIISGEGEDFKAALVQRETKYTSNNNEFNYLSVGLGNGELAEEDEIAENPLIYKNFIWALPKVTELFKGGDVLYLGNFARYKDNREIVSETIQFNFFDNGEDFILYDGLFEFAKWGLNEKGFSGIVVYYNTDPNIKFDSKTPFKPSWSNQKITFEHDEDLRTFTISVDKQISGDIYGWIAYQAAPSKPLFAVNGKNKYTIYGKEIL